MAKLKLIVEDYGDEGGVSLTIEGEENFPKDTKDWTPAQRATMWAYHALGTPTQDLFTTDTDGEG